MRRLFLLSLLIHLSTILFGQLAQRAELDTAKSQGIVSAKDYYHEGLRYKNGDGTPIDYHKAFDNFKKASDLGDAQSTYAVAYMHYKGLGCTQNYQLASELFALGAQKGRDNSMYFLGLCFRNGYGLDRNEDSAKYWLNKAAAMGYAQAQQELELKTGENANDSAQALISKIHNAALPPKAVLNQFQLIKPHIPSSAIIEGKYTGYLLGYDWSGAHIISNQAITFTLERPDNSSEDTDALSGVWTEKGHTSVPLTASLKGDSLIFRHTRYQMKDHYSRDKAIQYDFTSASLSLVQSIDSVYLAGNIHMFSPDRNEPAKPLLIALVRQQTTSTADLDTQDSLTKKDKQDSSDAAIALLKGVKVYPNPFVSSVTVEFTLADQSEVAIELFSINGALVYQQPRQWLKPGRYKIILSPGRISSGTYILRLTSPRQGIDVKVIHK